MTKVYHSKPESFFNLLKVANPIDPSDAKINHVFVLLLLFLEPVCKNVVCLFVVMLKATYLP